MPDEIDRSQQEQDAFLDASIRNAKLIKNALRPKGRCYFCDEQLDDKMLYCDTDCASDDEQMKRQRRHKI